MSVRYPPARWKPFTGKTLRPWATRPTVICLHTMVGTLVGSWAWANRPGQSYWHFGLGVDELWQCVDLNYRSAANLEGNPYVIPIETADTGGPFPPKPPTSDATVPPWTDWQVDQIVALVAWLCRRYDIPPVLIPDTKPGRRGIAYHRQGIDPWRVQGGDLWSKSAGKVCPGTARITQLTTIIIPQVRAIVNGDDDDMPYTPEQLNAIMRDAVADELSTPGSRTRSAVIELLRGSIESEAGPLNQALDSWYRQRPKDVDDSEPA